MLNYTEVLHNRYQIQKQLGCNINRYTYLAKDLQTHQLVIVKLLIFNDAFHWDDLKLFEREVKILQSLSHPSIPQYIEYFTINSPNLNGFALVQTYIDAQSLQTYLINGRTFSEIEVRQLAKQLLSILDYLHSHQPCVIHRDIKPSNVLLSNRSSHSVGDVYLVDFGSLHLANYQDGTITIVGTYGYMPPEQFGGKVLPASDIYSLGTTLIYLITGIEPADLPQENLQIQFEQFTHVSSSFRDWLKLMTHPRLKKRFSSVTESLNALESGKIEFNEPPLSRIIIEKKDDSLNITIPYKQSNSAKNDYMKSINKVKQKYHESWLSKILSILINPALYIFIFLIILPLIPIIIPMILISMFIELINRIKLDTFPENYKFINTLFPGINNQLSINETIKSIDSLNLNIAAQKISLTFNYTSKSKIKEVYTVCKKPVQRLSSIIFQKRSYEEFEVNTEGGKEIQEKEVPPMLFIVIGNQGYGLSYQLTTSETYFIAEEISKFIDIPITWV